MRLKRIQFDQFEGHGVTLIGRKLQADSLKNMEVEAAGAGAQ